MKRSNLEASCHLASLETTVPSPLRTSIRTVPPLLHTLVRTVSSILRVPQWNGSVCVRGICKDGWNTGHPVVPLCHYGDIREPSITYAVTWCFPEMHIYGTVRAMYGACIYILQAMNYCKNKNKYYYLQHCSTASANDMKVVKLKMHAVQKHSGSMYTWACWLANSSPPLGARCEGVCGMREHVGG